jgi:hypothetical protein
LLGGEFEPALRALFTEWNIAERRIKRAEQTRHNEVVISAIFELRYAGRKLIDALQLSLTEDAVNDEAVKARISAFLSDATEDCVKAKHDAIDSMLDFVTRWFREAEDAIGLGAVQRFFPNYVAITAQISDAQDKISESRGNRTTLRDSIYDELERDYFDEIVRLYRTMLHSHERVVALVKRDERRDRWQRYLAVGGFAVGILGILAAVIMWRFPIR